MTGLETTGSNKLIQGTCFINGTSLIAIMDTSATYLFVSLDCVERLCLKMSVMVGSMVIDTPANGSVTTS